MCDTRAVFFLGSSHLLCLEKEMHQVSSGMYVYHRVFYCHMCDVQLSASVYAL